MDTRIAASNTLLVVGYPLASVAGARLLPMLRQRNRNRFLALEVGQACVTLGLVLRRRWAPAALNGAAFVGLAALWAITSD